MRAFQSNIINIYGNKGKIWLDELPELVDKISSRFQLRDLKPLSNLSYNYVLSGFHKDTNIILKLGLDKVALMREAFALKCFSRWGAVKVLAVDEGMLLLERAVPGVSLRSYFPDKELDSIAVVCTVMEKLHQAKIPEIYHFPHIRDWLLALDQDLQIPSDYLDKARTLRDQLLKMAETNILLHGDLHHDNILQNGEDWMVIDPKGVIGEPAYEVAAFIRNPMPELLSHKDVPNIIHNRIIRFAETLQLPLQRILDWCFVQAMLSWIWALDDGCDTQYWEQMTKIFEQML